MIDYKTLYGILKSVDTLTVFAHKEGEGSIKISGISDMVLKRVFGLIKGERENYQFSILIPS